MRHTSLVVHLLSTMGLVSGCAGAQASSAMPTGVAPPGPAAAESTVSQAPSPETAPVASASTGRPTCDLVCGGAHVLSHHVTPDESADFYTEQAVKHADEVLNAMHDDLLACYTTRLRGYPKAHGFITVDIVIGPTGSVQNIETQGGALLGNAAMACIVDRIKRGQFDPPHGGGTTRLEVPFALRRVAPDEPI